MVLSVHQTRLQIWSDVPLIYPSTSDARTHDLRMTSRTSLKDQEWDASRLLKPLRRFLPIDHTPERLDVVWPSVLELEVVCVLPHIQSDDGEPC